ncbi:MAG: hypothetical protein K2N95_07050 [Lachnospiraceae bacterium]|nr:hypothetical protein [Lachnospiraceae bacterium]
MINHKVRHANNQIEAKRALCFCPLLYYIPGHQQSYCVRSVWEKATETLIDDTDC